MTPSTLGSRIREARKAQGLTILELSKKLKSYPANVSNWEAGKGKPRKTALYEIAGILNVPVEWLLTGAGKMSDDPKVLEKTSSLHQDKPHGALGHRIYLAISDSGSSQRELAEKMKIDPATISRYVCGDIGPSYMALQKIAKHTGCDPGWLLMGTEKRNLSIPMPSQSLPAEPKSEDPLLKMILELKEKNYEAYKKIVGEIAVARFDLT